MKTLNVASLACLFLTSFFCGAEAAFGLDPGEYIVEGNPTCADLALGTSSYKIDPPQSGTYGIDGLNTVSLTIAEDYSGFDWNATMGMDAVIVKGGPNANVYVFAAEATSNAGQPALHAPLNPDTGLPYSIANVEFCFDYEVKVTTAVAPVYVRGFSWSIDKSSTIAELILASGQTFTVPYSVTASVTGYVDSDFSFSESITIQNPTPFSATIEGITDTLSGFDDPLPVECGVTFPYMLSPSGTLSCSVEAILPDGSYIGTNEIGVMTMGLVGGAGDSATIEFAQASMDVKDGCVNASDSLAGVLGTACASSNEPTIFPYSLNVGPYEECGEYQFVNTATITTSDTGAVHTDTWPILVHVPCIGCTLGQGYWQSHSSYGPAPYDDTWQLLPVGADTSFFLSGQTYYEVLWTPVRGNAYYILANAYIAAQLNGLNDISLAAVQSAFDEATELFEQYTPSDIGVLTGRSRNALARQFITLSEELNDFNTGISGPGHCSE